METHTKGALHLGISEEQLMETMIRVAHHAGCAAGDNGQSIVLRLSEEEKHWKSVEAHKGMQRKAASENSISFASLAFGGPGMPSVRSIPPLRGEI